MTTLAAPPPRTPVSSREPDGTEPTPRRGPGPAPFGPAAVVAVATTAIATVPLAYAYRTAGRGSEHAAFGWFWLAMLTALAATVVATLSTRTSDRARTVLVSGFALFCYVPMMLRQPDGPLFYDELAHWAQSVHLAADGSLPQPSIISVISQYPGLHTLTVAIASASGLSVWSVGTILVATAHVLVLLGIVQLGRAVGLSARVASVAAIVYALDPGFLYFTSLYAYESLGIVFELWTVVGAVSVLRSAGLERKAWFGVALVAASGVAVTHHLSALVAVTFLAILLVATVRSDVDRVSRRMLAALTCYSAIATLGWMVVTGGGVLSYLAVYPEQGLSQLTDALTNHTSGGTSRGLFGGSGLPWYEPKLALLAVPVALVLALGGAAVLRRKLRRPDVRALLVIAALYPLSLPLVLTVSGSPAAHRSWPFTWQALSLLIAIGLVGLVDHARTPTTSVLYRGAAVLACCVLLVGSTATDFNAAARFPGPSENGVDGRTVTPEAIAAATWLHDNSTPDTRFIASDIFTAGIFSAYADATYAYPFPTWDITFYSTPAKPATVEQLAARNIEYLVVDRRVADSPYRGGFYIDSSEPGANTRTTPISVAAIDKLNYVDWLQAVYTSQNYVIYRVQAPQAAAYGRTP